MYLHSVSQSSLPVGAVPEDVKIFLWKIDYHRQTGFGNEWWTAFGMTRLLEPLTCQCDCEYLTEGWRCVAFPKPILPRASVFKEWCCKSPAPKNMVFLKLWLDLLEDWITNLKTATTHKAKYWMWSIIWKYQVWNSHRYNSNTWIFQYKLLFQCLGGYAVHIRGYT